MEDDLRTALERILSLLPRTELSPTLAQIREVCTGVGLTLDVEGKPCWKEEEITRGPIPGSNQPTGISRRPC